MRTIGRNIGVSIMLKRTQGISLVELLITMAVSLVVAGGTMAFYVSAARNSTLNSNTMRLNQELRSVMDVIARDIRRTGFRGNAHNCIGVGYTAYGTGTCDDFAAYTITGTSQIEFSYDENANAALETSAPDERYGYRLSGGEIEVKTGGGWQPMTDSSLVTISLLRFTPTTRTVYVNGVSGEYVRMREIAITVTGQLPSDATVQRTLTETARIRNDAFNI